jgi:glycosyltransferase involved in cell wall biosynthesis
VVAAPLRRIHALFHRATPWQAPIRCSTNVYARLFLDRGHDVTYMQGTLHPLRLVARRGPWESWRRGPRRDAGAWVFTPFTPLPFMGRGPFATPRAAEWTYLAARAHIERLVEQGGRGPPDVVWTVPPGSSALARIFPHAVLVHQVVDFYPAFGGPHTRAIERRDYARAHHVFCVGHALRAYVVGELGVPADKVTVLEQGVHAARYTGPPPPLPASLAGAARPIAIWVGWLDKADAGLMGAAARALTGGTLVLAGAATPCARDLAARARNVRLIGEVPHEDVPALLRHADVGLMLYDRTREAILRGQSPLKLYEYAAAGLPILSTPHDEYAYTRPPVQLVAHEDDVAPALARALDDPAAHRARARAFAADADWSQRYETVAAVLAQLLG